MPLPPSMPCPAKKQSTCSINSLLTAVVVGIVVDHVIVVTAAHVVANMDKKLPIA